MKIYSRLTRAIGCATLLLTAIVLPPHACGQTLIAHRGASYDAPENTLAAFRTAWDQGADGIEADFHLTFDGHIACIHDADTKRVAGAKLAVGANSFEKLRALDVGKWKDPKFAGERIATFAEVLDAIPSGKRFVVELKVGPEIVKPFLETLAAGKVPLDDIAVISFREDTIAEVERLAPHLKTHWLSGYEKDATGKLVPTAETVAAIIKRIHANGFGSQANLEHFDEAFIAKLRDEGCREFHVWTIDDPAVAEKYLSLGATWVTTNRPGWLRERLAARSSSATDTAANEPPAGFVRLFNGTDLSGWKGLVADPVKRAKMSSDALATAQATADERMRAHWQVKNGVLEFDGRGDSLCTAKDYGDFELLVDWKIPPAADSGIYLRGNPQVQIWDTENEAAWQHGAEKGSGGLWNNKQHERFPLVKADRPAGQWNTMLIRMVGDRVTVKLNDQLVVDNVPLENYWESGKPLPATGSIELQNHGNNLWFRNIYVRELTE